MPEYSVFIITSLSSRSSFKTSFSMIPFFSRPRMIVLYTVPLRNYNKIFYVDMLVLSYFFSATYLLLLIVLFTSNNITEEIILSSIYSFMVVFTAFMYFAKRYNIQYNIPNIVTTARLIINIFI